MRKHVMPTYKSGNKTMKKLATVAKCTHAGRLLKTAHSSKHGRRLATTCKKAAKKK